MRDIADRLQPQMLCQVYGMTETGGITTMTEPTCDPAGVAESVGRPLENFELRVVDHSERTVETGAMGELLVKSPYNLIEYYGMSTAQRASAFSSDGWFKTGDLMSQDEGGAFHFHGRLKDVIKVGGENVSAAEVEQVLSEHDAIRQVAVVGVPDTIRGEAIVAFIELTRPTSEAELERYCRERMAAFKRPKYFVVPQEWPLTETGKIQKFRLRDDYLNPQLNLGN